MSFAVFAANKSKTGGALIAKQTQDNSVLLAFFKQIDFDQNNKKNNFDFSSPINVKMSDDELGDFLRAIRTNSKSQFYHTFDNNTTTGSLGYFEIKDKADASKPPYRCFSFSVTKGEATVKVTLSLGAAERFGEYIRFSLNKSFEASFIEDLRKDAEYREKAKNKGEKSSAPAKKEKPADPTPADDGPGEPPDDPSF
jgi:hypothetical protein